MANGYMRCDACGQDGVKIFADVCSICHTSQKQYKKQRDAEFKADWDTSTDLASRYPWLSIPVGLIIAIIAFALTYERFDMKWTLVMTFFAGVLGFVYSMKVLKAIIGLIVLVALFMMLR